jgi:hypothetical protein
MAAQAYSRTLEFATSASVRGSTMLAETEVSLALTLLALERQAEPVELLRHALLYLLLNPTTPTCRCFDEGNVP